MTPNFFNPFFAQTPSFGGGQFGTTPFGTFNPYAATTPFGAAWAGNGFSGFPGFNGPTAFNGFGGFGGFNGFGQFIPGAFQSPYALASRFGGGTNGTTYGGFTGGFTGGTFPGGFVPQNGAPFGWQGFNPGSFQGSPFFQPFSGFGGTANSFGNSTFGNGGFNPYAGFTGGYEGQFSGFGPFNSVYSSPFGFSPAFNGTFGTPFNTPWNAGSFPGFVNGGFVQPNFTGGAIPFGGFNPASGFSQGNGFNQGNGFSTTNTPFNQTTQAGSTCGNGTGLGLTRDVA